MGIWCTLVTSVISSNDNRFDKTEDGGLITIVGNRANGELSNWVITHYYK